MEENKTSKVSNENFDWNAYENDLDLYDESKESITEKYDQTLSKVQVGEVVEGTVIGINKREVVVNIGYKSEGIIPATEFRYNPDLAIGEKVEVFVESAENKKGQLALSHKKARQLKSWDRVNQAMDNNEIIKGYIKCRTKGGMIVDVFGIEGLIHVSEMSWSQHLRSAQEFMKVGDEVEAVILTLDYEERKMSLGTKQLTPDPWENIETKYPVGSKHTAKVRNFTNFGVFVEIEEGIDGLIHISDLSWTKKIKHPAEFTQIGADIDVIVLEIDKENRRLSLGHKQLEDNPWDEFEAQFSVDSIHEGTITEITDKGAIVSLGENIEGFAPAKQIVKEDGSVAKVGETLPFKVLEFSKTTKRIHLSHTRIFEEAKRAEENAAKAERRAEADDMKSSVKKINASVEKATLGDIAGLAELKANLQEAEKAAKKEENKE